MYKVKVSRDAGAFHARPASTTHIKNTPFPGRLRVRTVCRPRRPGRAPSQCVNRLFDIDASAIGDEAGAFRPGPLDEKVHDATRSSICFLEHVGADIDLQVTWLRSPTNTSCSHTLVAAHRGNAALGLRRRIERELGAVAVRQVLDRADRVVGARVDGLRRAEFLARSSRSSLTSSAMTRAPIAAASCVADSPTGPLAEDRDRAVAGGLDAAQRTIGRAGAARDRRAGGEKDNSSRQRHQR